MTSPAASGNLVGAPGVTRHGLAAFGLAIECDWPLTGSSPCPAGAGTRISQIPSQRMDAEWARPGEPVFEPEYPDGRRRFAVELDDRHYRLWFVEEGRYLVSTDGTSVVCDGGAVAGKLRERILFAQVLPFAAALQGFEVLHASAVSVNGSAVAFAGAPGAGKTSLARRLAFRGGPLVTDDVLALELGHDGLICHAGPPLMVLAEPDLDAEALGPVVGRTDKVHVSVTHMEGELPLRTLFYLERGDSLDVRPLEHGEMERVLASFFAPYLVTPSRLRGHFDTASLLSTTVRQFRLSLPHPADFDAVLAAIEPHLR